MVKTDPVLMIRCSVVHTRDLRRMLRRFSFKLCDLIEVVQLRDFNDTQHRNWGTGKKSCVRVHPWEHFPQLQSRLISLASLWLGPCPCHVYFCPPFSKVPHQTFVSCLPPGVKKERFAWLGGSAPR